MVCSITVTLYLQHIFSLLTFVNIVNRSIVRVCKVCLYILLWALLQESPEDTVNSNVSEQFTVSIQAIGRLFDTIILE